MGPDTMTQQRPSQAPAVSMSKDEPSMTEAEVNGTLVVAGPDAPDTAICPDCATQVYKRHVTRMDGTGTYFDRHS
jgi:hypothetical protein